MWNHPFIYYDGTVTTCVFNLKDSLPIGNVLSANGSDFTGIWFGDRFKEIRGDFLDYRKNKQGCGPEQCKICHRNYADCNESIRHVFTFQH